MKSNKPKIKDPLHLKRKTFNYKLCINLTFLLMNGKLNEIECIKFLCIFCLFVVVVVFLFIVNLLLLDCFVIVCQLNKTYLISTPGEMRYFHIQPTKSLTVFSCSPRYFVNLQ